MNALDSVVALLPHEPLPQWLTLVSVISIASGLNALVNPIKYSRNLYSANVTELVYGLTMGTFLIALAHFSSEVFVFKTMRLSGTSVSPFVVATTSALWMWSARSIYVPQLF
ncbi:hypothetical protein BCR44DRAFT_1441055 [Catenaria anguillulae PL171]|uniref:Uncharacterized protein n=1 Tax=Catenaria anguillulae PL171 TaxID=765915 RepID=A0A1Y2HBX4_9FUNG|nr:hypothetical protein BCR44DRAFT_1441055 [Catenaria anguillulae PL171]